MQALRQLRMAALLIASIAVPGACSGAPTTSGPASPSTATAPTASAILRSQSPTPPPSPAPSTGPTPPPCATPIVGPVDPADIVLATANIFGAGHQFPPAPGGGGRGTPPPVHELAPGARFVSFPRVVGCVNPIRNETPFNGPAGDRLGPTDVTSFEGIAGIVHGKNGMFLVGVFLTAAEPTDPAPARLDFTDKESFSTLAPKPAQVFLIGDGAGKRYAVPKGATRLFLGFADAARYEGPPGWYGNNAGELQVTVEVEAG